MEIYLPIAGMSVQVVSIIFLGIITGILSGMFGIGGGFILTPVLIFMGVPPSVAASSSANQIISASSSGFIAHLRRRNVDFKVGFYLLIGGFFGSLLGIVIFSFLYKIGQINIVISIIYILILGFIAFYMLIESSEQLLKRKNNQVQLQNDKYLGAKLNLPFKTYFPSTESEVSILIPIFIGFISSMLVAIMGIGGGFIMVPAMIYLLGMTITKAVGTSLFQMIFISIIVTFLHCVTSHTVDIMLTLLMLAGTIVGAQLGTKLATKVQPEKLRIILALMILGIVIKLTFGLVLNPDSFYEIIENNNL